MLPSQDTLGKHTALAVAAHPLSGLASSLNVFAWRRLRELERVSDVEVACDLYRPVGGRPRPAASGWIDEIDRAGSPAPRAKPLRKLNV